MVFSGEVNNDLCIHFSYDPNKTFCKIDSHHVSLDPSVRWILPEEDVNTNTLP